MEVNHLKESLELDPALENPHSTLFFKSDLNLLNCRLQLYLFQSIMERTSYTTNI